MKRRKCRIKYKKLLFFILVLFIIIFCLFKFLSLNITNIYVFGNEFLSDQYIIELAHLEDYPNAFSSFSETIESRISKNNNIRAVKVYKKGFTKVYIEVFENKPLFYDEINKCIILMDGSKSSELYDVPVLVNVIDDSIYNEFLSKFSNIDKSVLNVISEIKYDPNEVDKELFLMTMKDGNYVYVNLDKFDSINNYLNIIIQFNNNKGILYLDSGEYFKIL